MGKIWILLWWTWNNAGPRARATHWKQTVLYLEDVLTICEGEALTGHMTVAPNKKNPRDIDIMIKYALNGRRCVVSRVQYYKMRWYTYTYMCSIDRSMAKIDAFTATSVSSELLLLGSYVYFIILICWRVRVVGLISVKTLLSIILISFDVCEKVIENVMLKFLKSNSDITLNLFLKW